MYESDYEKYMKSVLGYSTNDNVNTYYDGRSYFPYANEIVPEFDIMDRARLDDLYPEIYKLLKPMIAKACSNSRGSEINSELLERMTLDIYNSIEPEHMPQSVTDVDIRQNSKNVQNSTDEQRGCKNCNPLMKDLIKILLLDQIINNRPPRPPKPPVGPRPPKPGPGPFYPPRPPYFF